MSTYSSPCAYCLNEGSNIVDPRQLPCHHVFCFGCLEDALPTQPNTKMFKCPVCRIEHTLDGHDSIISLPKAILLLKSPSGQGLGDPYTDEKDIADDSCCDACSRKGSRHAAVVFCQHCNLRLCAGDHQSHDHLFGHHEHPMISFEEFSRQRDRLAVCFCSEHSKQLLDFVCVKCKKLFCLICWAHAAMDCGDGEKHKMKPVLAVGEEMKKRLSEAVEPVILLQSKLDKLVIQLDERLTSAVTELDDLIIDLHKARDLQLEEINRAYWHIEENINKVRGDTIVQYRAYHEKLQEEIRRLQSACKEADQMITSGSNIDIVLRADHVIRSLTAESLGETELPSVRKVEIVPTRHSRLAEVDLLITAPKPHGAPPAGIRAVHLDKRITTEGQCYDVSHSAEGGMVVCREKGFDYLDTAGNFTNAVELGGNITCCCLYNNCVYVVHSDNSKRWIRIYDMGGQLMHWWPVSDTGEIRQLAVVGEIIFLPNPDTQLIVVYSRSGDWLDSFTHASFHSPNTVTAADHHHIIVTDDSALLVSMFTISGYSLVWLYKVEASPTGVAVDECGRIWVASYKQTLWNLLFVEVLSADGQLLVTLDVKLAISIRGISVHGDQLAVATGVQNELVLYKIAA